MRGGAAIWSRMVQASFHGAEQVVDKEFYMLLLSFLNAQRNERGDLVFIDDGKMSELFSGIQVFIKKMLRAWEVQVGCLVVFPCSECM